MAGMSATNVNVFVVSTVLCAALYAKFIHGVSQKLQRKLTLQAGLYLELQGSAEGRTLEGMQVRGRPPHPLQGPDPHPPRPPPPPPTPPPQTPPAPEAAPGLRAGRGGG